MFNRRTNLALAGNVSLVGDGWGKNALTFGLAKIITSTNK
jgi:hypothetical protein